MPPPGENSRTSANLESWKEIAHFFGVTIRTAQLWEHTHGLPVRRAFGERGRVYATMVELEQWRRANERRPAGSRSRIWRWLTAGVVIGAAAVLLVLGAIRWRPGGPEMVRWETKGPVLVTFDAQDREIWRYVFPFALCDDGPASDAHPRFADVDGDGGNELVFPARREGPRNESDLLYCFDRRGRVRWTYRPGKAVSTRKESLRNVFDLRWICPVQRPRGGGASLISGSSQSPDYPFEVAAIDANGHVERRYWHSGHLTALHSGDVEKDGRLKLYLGGISNAEKRAEIVVLDVARFGGASLERNPDFQLQGLGPPVEVARVLLPASLLSRSLQPYPVPRIALRNEAGWELHMDEGQERVDNVALSYQFGPRLAVRRVSPGDTSQVVYERLIRTGRLPQDAWKRDRARDADIEVLTPWREVEVQRPTN